MSNKGLVLLSGLLSKQRQVDHALHPRRNNGGLGLRSFQALDEAGFLRGVLQAGDVQAQIEEGRPSSNATDQAVIGNPAGEAERADRDLKVAEGLNRHGVARLCPDAAGRSRFVGAWYQQQAGRHAKPRKALSRRGRSSGSSLNHATEASGSPKAQPWISESQRSKPVGKRLNSLAMHALPSFLPMSMRSCMSFASFPLSRTIPVRRM